MYRRNVSKQQLHSVETETVEKLLQFLHSVEIVENYVLKETLDETAEIDVLKQFQDNLGFVTSGELSNVWPGLPHNAHGLVISNLLKLEEKA